MVILTQFFNISHLFSITSSHVLGERTTLSCITELLFTFLRTAWNKNTSKKNSKRVSLLKVIRKGVNHIKEKWQRYRKLGKCGSYRILVLTEPYVNTNRICTYRIKINLLENKKFLKLYLHTKIYTKMSNNTPKNYIINKGILCLCYYLKLSF